MFKNSLGTTTLTEEPIFPLISYDPDTGIWKCVGTGFFIQGRGVFVTARHVFFRNDGEQLPTLYGVQTTAKNERHIRPIRHIVCHENADICIGMLGLQILPSGDRVSPEIATPFTLNFKTLNKGQNVRTYAFPLTEVEKLKEGEFEFTFQGKWAAGKIVAFCKEGSPIVRNRCYQTTMNIEHGASGGPVLKNNLVVGINSSGMEVMEGDDPISFITPIDLILDLSVPNGKEGVSVKELIKKGCIVVKK